MAELPTSRVIGQSLAQRGRRAAEKPSPMPHPHHLGKSGCSQERPPASSAGCQPISVQSGSSSLVCGLWGVNKSKAAGEAATHRSRSPSQPLLLSGTENKALDDKGCQHTLQREIGAKTQTKHNERVKNSQTQPTDQHHTSKVRGTAAQFHNLSQQAELWPNPFDREWKVMRHGQEMSSDGKK